MKTATALKLLATAGALSFVMVPSRAEAASCLNDVDCPEPACGGQVCDYNKGATCQPAGGAPKGQDGWCTHDSDCKCMGMGATCVGNTYCTFTTPPAGGSGGAGAGSGGASGTGGISGSGGSTSTGGSTESGGTTGSGGGTASGGSTGSGGASSGSGGSNGSGGSSSGPASSNSSSGCSVIGSSPASVLGILFGLSVLALRRLRRRA